MKKGKVKDLVIAKKKIFSVLIAILVIFLVVGLTVFANNNDEYVVETKNDGSTHIAQDGKSSVTKKIIEDSTRSLTYELKVNNLTNVTGTPEIAIVIDTSRSIEINDIDNIVKERAIQLVTELTEEVPNAKISISDNMGIKVSMNNSALTTYTTAINNLTYNNGSSIEDGIKYANSSYTENWSSKKYLIVISDATDSTKSILEECVNNEIEVYSVLANMTNSEYESSDANLGTVTMIKDVEDFSYIYNSVNDSILNVKVTDIFTSDINNYFDFEVISKNDDIEVQEQEDGYVLNIPAIKAGETKKLVFKLTLKDDVAIDSGKIYRELSTSENMKVEYTNLQRETKNYEMKVSPSFIICKKYSMTIKAVSEKSDKLKVSGLDIQVVGTIITGQDENGQDIVKTIYNEKLTTDSKGEVKIEDLKTLGDITFEIKPIVNQIGYSETSATQVIVHNDPTGVGTMWAESDTTTPEVDVVNRNITVILPINVQTFDLKVETIDINNSNIKLGNIEYRLIQPKLNSRYDMEALYGTTDSDGNLTFKPAIMTKDGTYEYILSQISEQEGYDSIGNVSVFVTFENGKVTKFVHKFNDNVSSELISEDEAKVIIGNESQKDDTFKLEINLSDIETNAKIEGAIYNIELTRVTKGGEQITTTYKGNATNEEGKIELEMPGSGNISLKITQAKSAIGYIEDTQTKEIVFVRKDGTVQMITAKDPIDLDANADTDANAIVVNLKSKMSTALNRVQVHLVDNLERDINIPGVTVGITKVGSTATQSVTTDGEGIANFIIENEEAGTYVYEIKILSGVPYGYTVSSLNLGSISISFGDDKLIYEVGDLNARVPYFETKFEIEEVDKFSYYTAKVTAGLEPDGLNSYNFKINLLDKDTMKTPIEGAKYDITITYGDIVRKITGRKTDASGMITTRLIGTDNITIEVKETESIKGYALNTQSQVIELAKIADKYQIISQEPYEYRPEDGENIGAEVVGQNIIYHDLNRKKTMDDTILNLYINKKDLNDCLVAGVRNVISSSTLEMADGSKLDSNREIVDANGISKTVNYWETDINGYFEILGIKVKGNELNNGERVDYFTMCEVDVNGNKVPNTEIKFKLTFRYNEYKEIVEVTNIEATWGNRLVIKREYSGYETDIAYESNVYLDLYTDYDNVGNFSLDLKKVDKLGTELPGAKYDVIVTRPDGSKLTRKGIDVTEKVELEGFMVTQGTTIEITETVAPIGYQKNEYTEILTIKSIDELTGEIEVTLESGNYETPRASMETNTLFLEDGSIKKEVKLTLTDLEIDTFKFGITVKDNTTQNPVSNYKFRITSEKGPQKDTSLTNEEGKTNVLIGPNYNASDYDLTNYEVEYTIKNLITAKYYKKLDNPIVVKVVFDMDGYVDAIATDKANMGTEGYGTIWSIESANVADGNDIDIRINVDPQDKLIVNVQTVDVTNDKELKDVEYIITPCHNIPGTGTTKIEVGYVNPKGIETYTIKQTNFFNNYMPIEEQQFRIKYDENGNILEMPESLTSDIEVVSYNGKEITIKINIEPKLPIAIKNIGYFDGKELTNGKFTIESENNETKNLVTDPNGNAYGYFAKFETDTSVTRKYKIKQEEAAYGYATVDEFEIEVKFDENRNIIDTKIIGDVNKNVEFVVVTNKVPSTSDDIGYNGNDKGIVNILVKNYPAVKFKIKNIDRQNGNLIQGTSYKVTSTINTESQVATTGEDGIAIANVDKSGYLQTVTYTITELSPSSQYQTLSIPVKVEVDFDKMGYIINEPRVILSSNIATANLPEQLTNEDKFIVNVEIQSNPVLAISLYKIDEETKEAIFKVDFELTARIKESELSNYTEEERGYLTLSTTTLTQEDYLSQVLDRLKISEEIIESIKQEIGLDKILQELINSGNLSEEEEEMVNNEIVYEAKVNKLIELGKATRKQINQKVSAVTYQDVIDELITKEVTTQDRVNDLLEIVKESVRLDVDYVTTDVNGQAILRMNNTLENKTIEYTLKETRKADGYDWLDEVVIFEITYDSTGKMISDNPIKLISGDIEISNINQDEFKFDVKVKNTASKEIKVHVTVEDVYDSEKKLETAIFDAFLVDTTKSISYIKDEKYATILESGASTAHGEDTQSLGVYTEGNTKPNRILRLVEKQSPTEYYKGTVKHSETYQSIAYALLVNIKFSDEGKILSTSLHNPGGDSNSIGYIADGRYISVSNTSNTINITIKYYPMLNIKMQSVDMYTGDSISGNFTVDTRIWSSGETVYQELISSGYINPHWTGGPFGKSYSKKYVTSNRIKDVEEAASVQIAPTEADTFNQNKKPDTQERIFYIYENAEPNSPLQYQTYLPRHITKSIQYMLAEVKVTYTDIGEVKSVELLKEYSKNNIPNGFIEVGKSSDNPYEITIKVKYAPITTVTATVVDDVSGAPLSGIRINPYVNKTNTSSTSYEYRTILYYTTGKGGSASWTYWGASIKNGGTRYTLNTYTVGTGYEGYIDPQNIILDVSYGDNGRISNVELKSVDEFGDKNAFDITWDENNHIELKIRYCRKFNLKLNKVDYYDSNTRLSAAFKVMSDHGALTEVAAGSSAFVGKIYPGRSIIYTLSETAVPSGYIPITNLTFGVTFKNNGTIKDVWTDSDYFELVNFADIDATTNSVGKVDLEANIKNKPRFDITIDLSDKFYPTLKLEGAIFSIENNKGDTALGAVTTDSNGILETYVGPIYPNEEVIYTIRQLNIVNGYYENDEVVQLRVKFNENGRIEEYNIVNNVENSTIDPQKYINKKGITIMMTNMPKDIKVGVYKYDELTNQAMANIKFNVKAEVINENTLDTIIVTNDNGTVVDVVDNFVKREDYRTVIYTVSEIEVPNSYRKIQDVVIKVTYNPDGSMYLYDVLSNESEVKVELATNKLIKYTNQEPVHIKLTISNDNTYDLIIKNEDRNYAGLGIEGTKYNVSINGVKQSVLTTKANGIAKIINQTQNGEIEIRISESEIGEGYRADNNNDATIKIYKGEEIYSLELISNSNPTYAEVEVDEEHGTITVVFKNETKLELNLVKDDINTGALLQGAVFEITEQEIDEYGNAIEDTIKTITTDENNTTNQNGRLYFDLGLAKQNKIIEYTLTEITAPTGYTEIPPIKVKVTFDMYGRIVSIQDDSFRAECYLSSSTGKSHNMIFNVANGTKDPSYTVKVISADSQTGNRINGSIFQVEVFDESGATYKSVTGTTRNSTKKMGTTTYVAEKGIMKVTGISAENNVKIALNQVETLSGYVYGNNKVSGNVLINADFTVLADKLEKDVELSLVDNGGFDVTVDNKNREIIIKVYNDPILTFEITKKDKDGNKIEDAKFHITSAVQTTYTTVNTGYNEVAKATDSAGKTSLRGGIIQAGKTMIYTISEDKMEGYEQLDDIVVLVQYDTKGNILYYEILSDADDATIEDGIIKEQKRILGEDDVPGIVEVKYTTISVPTGIESKFLELEVTNTKEVEDKDYQIVIRKHHELDPDYPYRISGVTFEIKVTQEYGKKTTTWTDITDEDGIITSPYFSGYGNITIEIREIAGADGYKIDYATKTIRLFRNKDTHELRFDYSDVNYEDSTNDHSIIYLDPVNEIEAGIYNMVINKVDKNTNTLIEDNPADIEIYRVDQYEVLTPIENEETGEITYISEVTQVKEKVISNSTDSKGRIVADKLLVPEEEGTYRYIIKETKAPEGYIGLKEEAQIDITFAKNSDNEMIITNAVVISGENVKISKTADQLISIIILNENKDNILQDQYSLNITKVDTQGNAIVNDNAIFKLTDNQTEQITYFETDEYGKLNIPKFNMPTQEGIYTYILNEVKAPEGYALNRNNIIVTIEFKQNNDAQTYINSVTVDGENIIYEAAEDGELPNPAISIKVMNEEGKNGTGNTNSKPYTVVLNKKDSTTKEFILDRATFDVSLVNGEIVHAATNTEGQIIIENVFMPSEPGEYEIVVKEVTSPKDYTLDTEIKIVKATFSGTDDNMVISNLILDDEFNTNIEIVTEESTEDKIVLDVFNEKEDDDLYVISKKYDDGEDIYDVMKQYAGKQYKLDNPFIDTRVAKSGNNVTVQDFINNLESNGVMTIWDKNGNQIEPTAKVKTGYILKATKGNKQLTFDIIIKGDIDGDGRVRSKDLDMLIKHLSGVETEVFTNDSIKMRAADILDDGNGRVRSNDLNEFYKVLSK